MMFLHTLRLAGDLSFYYAFAGFFAASFGGTPMPLVLVWPALCFGLASCFEGSRPLRTTLAALSAAALLLLPTGADKFCYFPAAVYPVLLAYTGDFAPFADAAGRAPALALPGMALLCSGNAAVERQRGAFGGPALYDGGSGASGGVQPHHPAGPGDLHPAGLSAAFRRRAGGGVRRAVPAQPQCCGCRCKGGCVCRLLWRDRAGAAARF